MSNKIKLIGLSGKRGAGKDTFASIFDPAGDYRSLSFGDCLKDCAGLILNGPFEDYHTQEGKARTNALGMTNGEALQKIGDGLREAVHPDIWINAAFNRMKPEHNYINPSVRYPNEAEAITARGGVMIRVEGNPTGQQGDGTRDDNHPSETSLDNYRKWDVFVFNNGTLEDLELAVLQVQRYLNGNHNPDFTFIIDAKQRRMLATPKRDKMDTMQLRYKEPYAALRRSWVQ